MFPAGGLSVVWMLLLENSSFPPPFADIDADPNPNPGIGENGLGRRVLQTTIMAGWRFSRQYRYKASELATQWGITGKLYASPALHERVLSLSVRRAEPPSTVASGQKKGKPGLPNPPTCERLKRAGGVFPVLYPHRSTQELIANRNASPIAPTFSPLVFGLTGHLRFSDGPLEFVY